MPSEGTRGKELRVLCHGRGVMRRNRLSLYLAILLAMSAVAVACGDEGEIPASGSRQDSEPTSSIRGKVIQINESSGGDATESIVVKVGDEDITFRLDESIDQKVWNPSHLQGHMFFGEEIGIVYSRENGTFLAVKLTE